MHVTRPRHLFDHTLSGYDIPGTTSRLGGVYTAARGTPDAVDKWIDLSQLHQYCRRNPVNASEFVSIDSTRPQDEVDEGAIDD